MLLCVAGTLMMSAATVKCLVVKLSDNTLLYYPVAQKPTAVFSNGVMKISNDNYTLSTIGKLYIDNIDETLVGISAVTADEALEMQADGLLRVKCSGNISLYNMKGQLIGLPITAKQGVSLIDTTLLPKGCYIVKAGTAVLKFVKH